MKPTLEINTLSMAMNVALDIVRATGSGDGQAAVQFLINEIDRLQALVDARHSNPPARVGDLPPDMHFEYEGRICQRGGIYCSDEKNVFGLDADTLVSPRPDIDANTLHVGGKASA